MLYLIRNKFLSLADSIDTKFTCEQEPRFPPGNHSWSDESSSSSTSYDPFPDHDGGSSSEPNCLHTRYACSTSLLTTYNVSSWHQDIHKNHNDPSGYGTHDDCIFCKSCESLCASYRKRKYPSSTSLLLYYSTNTHYSLFNHFKSFISFNRIKEHTILYFGIQQ